MKKIKDILKQFALGLMIGVVIGIFTGITLGIITYRNQIDFNDITFVSKGLIFVLAFVLSIFIHELGHMVLGLWSGYSFSSFRLLFFHVQKNDEGKLSFHFHHVPNTLGQCLMKPPQGDDIPIFWYNFGGVLFNLIFAVLAIIFVLFMKNVHLIFFFLSSLGIGVFTAIVNWLPISGSFNDGMNYRLMKNNAKTKAAFFYLLDLNEQIKEGTRITKMDFSAIEALELDGEDHLQLNILMYLLYHYQLKFDTDNYQALLEKIYPRVLEGSTFLHVSLEADYYFMKLLLGYEDAEDYMTKDVKRYLNSAIKDEKKLLMKLVIRFYTELKVDQDEYERFVKACEKSVSPGYSLDLLDYGNILLDR